MSRRLEAPRVGLPIVHSRLDAVLQAGQKARASLKTAVRGRSKATEAHEDEFEPDVPFESRDEDTLNDLKTKLERFVKDDELDEHELRALLVGYINNVQSTLGVDNTKLVDPLNSSMKELKAKLNECMKHIRAEDPENTYVPMIIPNKPSPPPPSPPPQSTLKKATQRITLLALGGLLMSAVQNTQPEQARQVPNNMSMQKNVWNFER